MAERITVQEAVRLARAEHGGHVHARIHAAILAAGGCEDHAHGAILAFITATRALGLLPRGAPREIDAVAASIGRGIVEATLRAAGIYAEIPNPATRATAAEFPAWHRAFFDPSFGA